MPRTQFLQTNFSAGALSPKVRGRTDIDGYRNGAKLLHNCYPVVQGGVKRRPGTRYVSSVMVPTVCSDAYGIGYYPEFLDSFDTDGNLSGASAETSPNDSWTYSATSSVRSGGSVAPAIFTASGDQVSMYKALASVFLGGEERLQMKFFGVDYTLFVELTRSSGPACFFRFIGATETIEDTFSIGLDSRVTIGIDGAASGGSLSLYVSPDLVTTPVATLSEGLDPFPTYTQLSSFEFWCDANASVDFIRICGYVAP